jgi:hypothetical protein
MKIKIGSKPKKKQIKTDSEKRFFKHTKISSAGQDISLYYYFLYSRGEEQVGAFLGSGIRILN